jgi:prefoldin subunit 5
MGSAARLDQLEEQLRQLREELEELKKRMPQ